MDAEQFVVPVFCEAFSESDAGAEPDFQQADRMGKQTSVFTFPYNFDLVSTRISVNPVADSPLSATKDPPRPSREVTAPESSSLSTGGDDESTSVERVTSFDVATSKWKTQLTFVLGDVLGILLLFGTIHLLIQTTELAGTGNIYPLLLVLIPTVLVTFLLAGLYRHRFCHPALEMPRVAVATGTIGGTAALTTLLVTGEVTVAVLAATWGTLGMLVLPAARVCTRVFWSRTDWWGIPVVIITSETNGQDILRTLRLWPEIGLRPSVVLRDPIGEESASQGSDDLAPDVAEALNIPYAIVATPSEDHAERSTLLHRYSEFFDHVWALPDDRNLSTMWTSTVSATGLFMYSVRHSSVRPAIQYMKRGFDVVVAGLITLLLLPVLVGIAIAIRRDSTGPVFYKQERMGQDGRIFRALKFRTMYENADEKSEETLAGNPALRQEYNRYEKLENDPRVTEVGEFLQQYSLDELPQFLNVLSGEMSLVGPRAYRPSELPEMSRLSRAVLQIPPGITGLWQVSGRNHLSFVERVELDVHYTENWSLWLDLYLMARTIPAVLSGDGAA